MAINAAAVWLNTTFAGLDESAALLIHQLYVLAGGFFTPFFNFISFLGHDGIPLIIISLALILFRKTRRFGTAMLLSIAVGALITNCCLKILVARPRPYTYTNKVFYDIWTKVGMPTESDKSFPSGHTTAAFAFSTAIFLVGDKRVSWTAFLFGILMGISRIYLAVHYCSDVLAAVIVGIAAGVVGTLIAQKLPGKYYRSDWPFERKKKEKKRGGAHCSA